MKSQICPTTAHRKYRKPSKPISWMTSPFIWLGATLALFVTIMTGCGTYQGNEQWRLSACKKLVNDDERARCEEEARRSENDYKQDVEEALDN